MCKHFVLWGGTGQAKVLNEALQRLGHQVIAVVDNEKIVSPLTGVPILNGKDALKKFVLCRNDIELYGLVAIGGGKGKDRLVIADIMKETGISMYTLIHPNAFVALDASIGEGSQVLAQSAVCTHARIGKCAIINTSATVDHDVRIDDGAHIAPGAKLAGEVHVGACAFIGAGAVVLPGLHIGAGATVGAGAVVTRDVAPMAVVVGNPARVKR